MAKRELSSTLKNLKFMQRAAQREEKPKKVDEVIPDVNIPSSSASKRCVIIMEGDPIPGATRGRMSFQGFNPSIDKLSEAASKPEGLATCSSDKSEINQKREDGTAQCAWENSNLDGSCHDPNEDLKRKQDDASSGDEYPNKSQKSAMGDPAASPSNTRGFGRRYGKKPKREKTDWSVLRPPKSQKKKH